MTTAKKARRDPMKVIGVGLLAILPALCLLSGSLLFAAESGAEEDQAAAPAKIMRDPFWPVGYWPKSVASTNRSTAQRQEDDNFEPDWHSAETNLANVTSPASTGLGGRNFVTVNGQVAGVGDELTLKVEDYVYRWRIEAIDSKKGLKLIRLSARSATADRPK